MANLFHFYATEDLPHDERERIHVCQPERLERSLLVNTERTEIVEQKQNDFYIGLDSPKVQDFGAHVSFGAYASVLGNDELVSRVLKENTKFIRMKNYSRISLNPLPYA